jgi:hypothetical protein
MAMAVAARAGHPGVPDGHHGRQRRQAGSLSPFAPTGIIVNGMMDRIGLCRPRMADLLDQPHRPRGGRLRGYFLFGGWRLFRLRYGCIAESERDGSPHKFEREQLDHARRHSALLIGVLFFGRQRRDGRVRRRALLGLLRAADHGEGGPQDAVGVIIMVSGVTVLIALLEKTQGHGPVH